MTDGRAGSNFSGAMRFLLVLVAALVGARLLFGGGVAATPDYFTYHTVAAAMPEAQQTGRPVLAFATADWCGPCQGFKRGTLADDDVAEFIASRTVPVYIDVTESHPDASMLGVSGIPAVYIIGTDGRVVDSTVGATGTQGFLAWLRGAVEASGG